MNNYGDLANAPCLFGHLRLMRVRLLTLHGATRSVTEWARLAGLRPQTLSGRLARGVPLELALHTNVTTRSAAGTRGAARSPWMTISTIPRTTA